MNKVNQRLPAKERFGFLWWHVDKHTRLRQEYRRMYPDGKLLRRAFILEITFFLLMLLAGWAYEMLPFHFSGK